MPPTWFMPNLNLPLWNARYAEVRPHLSRFLHPLIHGAFLSPHRRQPWFGLHGGALRQLRRDARDGRSGFKTPSPPHPDRSQCTTMPLAATVHAHRYGGSQVRSMTISLHLPANAPLSRITVLQRAIRFRGLNSSACRWWMAGAAPPSIIFTPIPTPAFACPQLRTALRATVHHNATPSARG